MGRVAVARRLAITIDHRCQVPGQRHVPTRQMGRIAVRQRANDRQPVGQPGDALEMFADERTGHGRGNRLERPANFGRCVRLGVEGFELAGAAPHKEENARLGPTETRTPLIRRRCAGKGAAAAKVHQAPGQGRSGSPPAERGAAKFVAPGESRRSLRVRADGSFRHGEHRRVSLAGRILPLAPSHSGGERMDTR